VLGVLQDDNGALSRDAARIVAKTVLRQPRVTVGLATGSTPIGMYQELVQLHQEEELDFAMSSPASEQITSSSSLGG
jgi:glucosamine-6-phosphate deaminase